MVSKEEAESALKTVFDPEIGINIVDLGLIYGIEPSDDGTAVKVTYTLTSPACPIGPMIMEQIQEAVARAHQGRSATGKNPRKNPKHFKRAEIQTRNLVKQLRGLSRDLNYDEREVVESVMDRVSAINDQLLLAIMTKKK